MNNFYFIKHRVIWIRLIEYVRCRLSSDFFESFENNTFCKVLIMQLFYKYKSLSHLSILWVCSSRDIMWLIDLVSVRTQSFANKTIHINRLYLRCGMIPSSNRIDRFDASVVSISIWFFQTLKSHSNRIDRSGFFRFEIEEILYIEDFYI